RFAAVRNGPGVSVASDAMTWELDGTWYYGVDLARERERGREAREDHVCAALGSVRLDPGQSCTIELRADDSPSPDGEGDRWDAFADRERALVRGWRAASLPDAVPDAVPGWVERLVIASDQFIVRRGEGDTV